MGGQFLVQAAPVHADADRLVILDSLFNQDRKLAVAFPAESHVARINAVLGQGLGAVGVFRQQLVAVIVEIADQGHVATQHVQPLPDTHHLARRILVIHRDTHQFRPGRSQLLHLLHRRNHVSSIRIRHGLDDHRRTPAHYDRTNFNRNTAPPVHKTLPICHTASLNTTR